MLFYIVGQLEQALFKGKVMILIWTLRIYKGF